ATDERTRVGDKERDGARHFDRLAVPFERVGEAELALVGLASGQEARRHRAARRDAIDWDVVRAQLRRKRPGVVVHSRLGGAVDGAVAVAAPPTGAAAADDPAVL